jgi:hypothetical protein
MGITEKTTKAGTADRNGARMKTRRSAFDGIRSSFMISLRPSARVCSRPQGPALLGPTRFWKSEISFRSNQIMRITPTSNRPKAMSVLASTMRTSARPMPPSSSGSTAKLMAVPPVRR